MASNAACRDLRTKTCLLYNHEGKWTFDRRRGLTSYVDIDKLERQPSSNYTLPSRMSIKLKVVYQRVNILDVSVTQLRVRFKSSGWSEGICQPKTTTRYNERTSEDLSPD